MKLFVPGAADSKMINDVLMATAKFAKESTGRDVTDKRIYKISYRHNGKNYTDKVGEDNISIREPVLVILEASDMYFICTPNRGVLRGEPIFVGKIDTYSVEEFEK